MRDLPTFRAELRKLGIKLGVRTDAEGRRRLGLKGSKRAMTAEILAEAKAREAELLAPPVGQALSPTPPDPEPNPSQAESPTYMRPDRGPPPAGRSWRGTVALWPIDWRRRWGRLANANEDRGDSWDVAEWRAFHRTARDLAAAEDRGEVPDWSRPDPSAKGELTDEEAVAAIDGAFAPAPRWATGRGWIPTT
jgi:hypothetical protein